MPTTMKNFLKKKRPPSKAASGLVYYTPGLPESGAALRAAALALSAKAIAIQAQRLKELRAASQIN